MNKAMNNNPNSESCASQCRRILSYLKDGNRLTSLEALKYFDCFRLASRISDLRRSHPEVEIKRDVIITGSGKRVAQYYIA